MVTIDDERERMRVDAVDFGPLGDRFYELAPMPGRGLPASVDPVRDLAGDVGRARRRRDSGLLQTLAEACDALETACRAEADLTAAIVAADRCATRLAAVMEATASELGDR